MGNRYSNRNRAKSISTPYASIIVIVIVIIGVVGGAVALSGVSSTKHITATQTSNSTATSNEGSLASSSESFSYRSTSENSIVNSRSSSGFESFSSASTSAPIITSYTSEMVSSTRLSDSTTLTTATATISNSITRGLDKGVTLTPKTYDSPGITDYLQKAVLVGNTISWAGDWEELASSSGSPAQVVQLARSTNLKVAIEAQLFSQTTGQLLRPLDNSTIANYESVAVSFAKLYHPDYMAFGIEANILYEKSPSNYSSFVSLFNRVYSQVKSVSSNTTIFTIFQLERMEGLQGGLYGGSDNANPEWSLINDFRMDVVGFTTYPDLIFKDPSEIPQNYYSQIQLHTTLPVVFTEIGWHSSQSPSGWESSPQEQAQFVSSFFALSSGLHKVLEVWSFLYDQDSAPVPFNSMGLFDSTGVARSAYYTWTNSTQ